MSYAWLVWSSILFGIWGLIYFSLLRKEGKKEMLSVSLYTSLFGFTEPFFVPEYWNPPSLFNLAEKTGFDIESFIFTFALGGIAFVIYEWIFPVRHELISSSAKHLPRHRYHLWTLLSAPIIFFTLLIATELNPIYVTIIALFSGGIFTWYCRPDLKKKMVVSAFIFLLIYSVYFLTLIALYPGYVEHVWNFKAISGILILGIPLEELLFALGVGFLWSSVYEHISWRKLKSDMI